MPILDPNGNPISTPQVAKIPTYVEMKKILDVATGVTIMWLQQRQCDPLTMHSIGVILSKLTFDGRQSQPEIENIISKAATDQLEVIKIQLLNASIPPSEPPTNQGTA